LNPNRIQKQLHSLYTNSVPPLGGTIFVWSFPSAQQEAAAIAQSCQSLINAGMAGRENQIVILISNRRLQLGMITQELGNLGLPFDAPSGVAIRDEDAIRAAYSVLRIVRDRCTNSPDYLAHRSLLTQLHGVGANTAKGIGDQCVENNQNFRALFDLPVMPHWLNGRAAAAVSRIQSTIQTVNDWTLQDTIGARIGDIANILSTIVFSGSSQVTDYLAEWNAFASSLPQGMLLEEVLEYLAARDETDERRVLEAVNLRLGEENAGEEVAPARIRILTMHGAKGLSGSVVFIPAAEQGIMPSFRAIQAVGLLNEQRRLF
jgi:superfamily I DNA/RNA helicase